jgi:Ohr subfamily peroxiredoxin
VTLLNSAQATAIGGRGGAVAGSDGALRVKLGNPGSSPEQLFAASYAACFLEALKIAAAEADAPIADDANVTVTVRLARPDDTATGGELSAAVAVDLPNFDRAAAEALAARAHALCPYSEAARSGFAVKISVP